MKLFSWLLLIGILPVGALEPMPINEPAKSDWIFENFDALERLQDSLLKIPDDFPKDARKDVLKTAASKIKHGMSFKIVLALLGLPHEVIDIRAGSGPVDLPATYWRYRLKDTGEIFQLRFQLNKNLDDEIVTGMSFSR
ncbi:MAG: hypothetical protein WCP35_05650 [Verrucomicrobiota bacterium]